MGRLCFALRWRSFDFDGKALAKKQNIPWFPEIFEALANKQVPTAGGLQKIRIVLLNLAILYSAMCRFDYAVPNMQVPTAGVYQGIC